jgi:hypothetical protein
MQHTGSDIHRMNGGEHGKGHRDQPYDEYRTARRGKRRDIRRNRRAMKERFLNSNW